MTCARKPKVSGSSPAAAYVQRWALCSNRTANVKVSVKRVEVVVRSWKNTLPFPLQSYDSWMVVKENQIEKKKVLHNLDVHSKCIQFFIINLREAWRYDCFNSTGTKSHIFGPKNNNDAVSCYTECIWCLSKVPFLRRLYELVLDKNVSLRIFETNLGWL